MSEKGIQDAPKTVAVKSDEFIERLAKLIRTTSGLGSLLSTLSYSLYIAAYLDIKTETSRAQIISIISRLIGRTPQTAAGALKTTPATPPVSRLAPYIGLLNDTRFAIRLTGLIPMYLLLKSILRTPPKDEILRVISKVQIASYLSFTALENLWFLSNKNLLSPTVINRLGGSQELLKWSCRPWLLAIMCDYARLIRESQLASELKRKGGKPAPLKEQEAAEKKWWSELFTATAYLPMAIHYSRDGGIGLNLLAIGFSGMLGGSGTLTKLWAATKE